MPNKVCPKCSKSLHVRCSECDCGHLFYEKKTKEYVSKGGGPQKECPKCHIKLHVKKSECRCGHVFYEKLVVEQKVKDAQIIEKNKDLDLTEFEKQIEEIEEIQQEKIEQLNWKDLLRGEIIKSIQGAGPYFLKENGEKVWMGRYGVFQISKVDQDGIWAKPYKGALSSCGYEEFIYMGRQCASDILNSITKDPHNIIRFKPKLKVKV